MCDTEDRIAEAYEQGLEDGHNDAPAPLVWSSERPTVVGEYLVRCKSNDLREENLWLDDDDTPVAWDDDWEFAGPITVREPDTKGGS